MTAKNPQKQGRILEGGGRIFLAGQNIYPCCLVRTSAPPLQVVTPTWSVRVNIKTICDSVILFSFLVRVLLIFAVMISSGRSVSAAARLLRLLAHCLCPLLLAFQLSSTTTTPCPLIKLPKLRPSSPQTVSLLPSWSIFLSGSLSRPWRTSGLGCKT